MNSFSTNTFARALLRVTAAIALTFSLFTWIAPQYEPVALGASSPAFIQEKDAQIASGTVVSTSFSSATASGNLIVVYVIWDHLGNVTISDTSGNTYQSAVGPTLWSSGKYSAQVFYAANIKGGADTVKATFDSSVNMFGLVYAHEYTGVSQVAPLDGTAAAVGSSSSASSGSVTTKNPNDLLFGAGVSGSSFTSGGTGFTVRSTAQGNLTEDRIVSSTGSYSATATDNSGVWAMQLVAFKGAGGTSDTVPPTVPSGLSATAASYSQVNLSWAASTDNVGVAGYQVYRGGSLITTTTSLNYSDTGLTGATTYSYTVAAYDAAGNASAQSAPASATTPAAPADNQPPVVSITSPTGGQTISGTLNIIATASDNVGVASVQFLLDGANLSSARTTAPYSISWNTSQTVNGTHTLTAVASDAAGNQATSSPVTVNVQNGSVRTYTTNFPLAENPISEGGNWINGGQAPASNWTNMQTTPGLAFGTEPNNHSPNYNDSTALLTGPWGPDQTVTGVVHVAGNAANQLEVELRLRSSFSTQSCTGYEIDLATGYLAIVRWNGPLNDFAPLMPTAGGGIQDGDVVKATITGSNPAVITVYVNGVQRYQVTDPTPFTSGSPGMGWYTGMSGGDPVQSDMGLTSFTATDGGSGDATPPSTPTGLSATAVSSSAISLSWTASTDNTAVAGYNVFRNGSLIATSTSTNYTDTGLAASTQYTYTVSAYDGQGNTSGLSTPATTTTQALVDTTPPTISGITAANITTSGATIVWTTNENADSMVDYGPTAGYGQSSPLNSALVTSHSVTLSSLSANTTYHYRVDSRDASGNLAQSTDQTFTTAALTDPGTYSTTFPLSENPLSEGGKWMDGLAVGIDWANVQTTPNLAFGTWTGAQTDSIAILPGAWGPSQVVQATVHSVNQTDSLFEEVKLLLRSSLSAHLLTGYEVTFRCSKTSNAFAQIIRDNGAASDTTVLWTSTGSQYGVSEGDVVRASISGSTITVYINDIQIAQVSDSTFSTGSPGLGFYLSGASGVISDFGFTAFTGSDQLASDRTAPSVPTNLSGTPVSPSEIDLTWGPSTDNVMVAGYYVTRNNVRIATVPTPGFADRTVTSGTSYSYSVTAFDASGNTSAQSGSMLMSAGVQPDTTPPTIPTNLQSSNITSTSVQLSWTASTDSSGVAGYQVFRNGTQIATTSSTRYSDNSVSPSTSYTYAVAAYDTSNNVSSQSQALVVTTLAPATSAPTLVQVTNSQISRGSKVSVNFSAANQAKNTIVVYVIWNNKGSITVTDSRGDTFVNAGAAVVWGNGSSAQVFYASNIAGGANTVTATFRTSVTSYGIIYAHEYAGISAVNPVDGASSASGSSGSMNSGSLTTTSPNDLIFGAGVSDNTVTSAGAGFIARDFAYGNITEDRPATSIGSYAATATHNGKMWGMQAVAFRAAQ